MGTGECKIAKQLGRKGYFGRVVLEAQPNDNGQITVEFDKERAGRWQSGARFGIDYVLEHVSQRNLFPGGLNVRVTAIDGHEVDTTTSLIAYITARAMFQALGVEPAGEAPTVDFEKGLVEFAK